MDKYLLFREQSILLKHPTQPAQADSVVSLENHFAVFFTQECLVFSKATMELTKLIKLAAAMFRPVQVGPDSVCGIMIQQRRLIRLNLKTGDVQILQQVPTEIYGDMGQSYQWWNFHSILRFPVSCCFGYRQESNTTLCFKFFSLEREMSSMKFKKQNLKVQNTQVDQFDNDGLVAMFPAFTKRGRISAELFTIRNSVIEGLTIRNDNIEEGMRVRLLRKLPNQQLLVALDRKTQCDTTYLRLELETMEVLSVFNRNHCKLLKPVFLNQARCELILEEINSRTRQFQLTWLNYDDTHASEVANQHAQLSCDLGGNYLYGLDSKQPHQGQTRIMMVRWYRKRSLYSHLLHNMSQVEAYGAHLLHDVFDLLDQQ